MALMKFEFKCAVPFCENTKTPLKQAGYQISFYKFPENQEICMQWIQKCGKRNNWKPDYHYICSTHFKEEDFEPSAESESTRKLLHTAVPTLRLPIITRVSKVMLETIEETSENEFSSAGIESDPVYDIQGPSLVPAELYEALLKEFNLMRQSNEMLKKFIRRRKKIFQDQTMCLRKLEKQTANFQRTIFTGYNERTEFEQALQYFFTEAQNHLLVDRKTGEEWSNEALTKTLAIKYLSDRCYTFLVENLTYSLPDQRTLHRHVTKMNYQRGILHNFLCIMEIFAKKLSTTQKIAALQIGEIKVKTCYEYIKDNDEVIGAHSSVQVIMAVGLFAKWKQPVYLAFDGKITWNIIVQLLRKLQDLSYSIVACISDYSQHKSGLYYKLSVSPNRPYFLSPVTGEKVYYFVAASSLLRHIRNTLLDEGFTLCNGKAVSVEPLRRLIKCEDQHDVTISEKHLQCTGGERNDLTLATDLFSHKTSADLLRMKPNPDEALTRTTAEFICSICRWYTIAMGNDPPRNLQSKDQTLTMTSEMIAKLRVYGKAPLQMLQNAILISISSLRLISSDRLLQQVNTSTDKFGNDEVEHLFTQILGGKCATKLISPLNVITRFHKIMLGKNQDDTVTDKYLTHNVLSSMYPQEAGNELNTSPTADTSFSTLSGITLKEDDEVHYLVASVAQQFVDDHPEMGTRIHDLPLSPPYENVLVNMESIVEPSDKWAVQARQLNKVFEKFHKKGVLTGAHDVTKQTLNVVESLYPEIHPEVAKCFLEERLLLRIKYLNLAIEESKGSDGEEQEGGTK